MTAFLRLVVSLTCGFVFGFGLSLSGMLDPTRVRGFLDVFGHWDPSLAFVLAGAVAASYVGIQITRRMRKPILASSFDLPSKKPVDARLIVGSSLFGIGWGMSGLCPGPAIASLALGLMPTMLFTTTMLGGMALFALVGFYDRSSELERIRFGLTGKPRSL
jgi:uncharacterized membrane protein YedE/YeeE